MKMEFTISKDQMIISVEELKEAGLSHYMMNRLVEYGKLYKLNKKYYENANYQGEESDYYYVMAYAPQGVICLMSAASYYNLTTCRLDAIDVAIQRKSKISTMPDIIMQMIDLKLALKQLKMEKINLKFITLKRRL